jgi:hypothetical protein
MNFERITADPKNFLASPASGAEAKWTGARRLSLGQQSLDDELNQTIVPILS